MKSENLIPTCQTFNMGQSFAMFLRLYLLVLLKKCENLKGNLQYG
jgi:hypothetical protein